MSDEKTVTEREARLREREAFAAGSLWRYAQLPGAIRKYLALPEGSEPGIEAKRRYPITKKVPRVAPYPKGVGAGSFEVEVKFEGGRFWTRRPGDEEWIEQHENVTPDHVRVLADLMDNPFEEVEE